MLTLLKQVSDILGIPREEARQMSRSKLEALLLLSDTKEGLIRKKPPINSGIG